MAQKPVPNALTLELEPVVAQELRRHIDSEDLWYAHEYVPFDQGENFAFLGGRDWDPSDVTLPKQVTDALEILLIIKDNLAGYHRELVFNFILEDKWGRWIGRWTAEEHLHAVVLRNYLVVTREIDPAANEDVRVEQVMKGYRADTYSQLETLAFMALFERAHAVFCRNLQDADHRTRPAGPDRPDRHGRGTPRRVLRQPRRALPVLRPRRDDRGHRAPRRRTARCWRRYRRVSRTRSSTWTRRASSGPSNCARSSPTASPRGALPTNRRCVPTSDG